MAPDGRISPYARLASSSLVRSCTDCARSAADIKASLALGDTTLGGSTGAIEPVVIGDKGGGVTVGVAGARGETGVHARAAVDVHPRRIVPMHVELGIVVGHHPDEHARLGADQAIGRQSGVLERFPGHFKQQTLLRVHGHGFARRDAEELRLELIDAANEAAPARIHLAGRIGVWVVVGVDIPTVGRDLAHGIDAIAQQLPIGGRTVGLTREAATESHNGNGLGFGLALRRRLAGQLEQGPLLG